MTLWQPASVIFEYLCHIVCVFLRRINTVSQTVSESLKSVTHGQYDARPTITFPAAGHHRPLTGTELYCLATEGRVCEQLAQGCSLKVDLPRFEAAISGVASPTL